MNPYNDETIVKDKQQTKMTFFHKNVFIVLLIQPENFSHEQFSNLVDRFFIQMYEIAQNNFFPFPIALSTKFLNNEEPWQLPDIPETTIQITREDQDCFDIYKKYLELIIDVIYLNLFLEIENQKEIENQEIENQKEIVNQKEIENQEIENQKEIENQEIENQKEIENQNKIENQKEIFLEVFAQQLAQFDDSFD